MNNSNKQREDSRWQDLTSITNADKERGQLAAGTWLQVCSYVCSQPVWILFLFVCLLLCSHKSEPSNYMKYVLVRKFDCREEPRELPEMISHITQCLVIALCLILLRVGIRWNGSSFIVYMGIVIKKNEEKNNEYGKYYWCKMNYKTFSHCSLFITTIKKNWQKCMTS